MSGFVAIVASQTGRKVAESELAGLAGAYVAVRGAVAPAEHADGAARVRACVWRRADGAGAGIERRGASWAVRAGVPQHSGPLVEARLEDLDGQFALLRYDSERDAVEVASDPLGMFGLFVAERDGLVYVSTSALVLARHLRAAPSRLALQTYLILGSHVGARTHWQGVERVGGGVRMRFGARSERSIYCRPEVDASIRRLGVRASVDRCIEASVQATRAAGTGRDLVWCDLTGGYDTRMLALSAREAGLPLVATTSGTLSDADVRLARRVAAAGGWEWQLLSPPESWPRLVAGRLSEAVGWGDAALEAPQLAQVLWGHRVKAERAAGVLNGGGGEHFWSCAWQHEYGRSWRPGPTNVDMFVQVRMLKTLVPSALFAGDPRPAVIADLGARMAAVIEPYRDEPRTVQTDLLYMHKCIGHFGAYATAAAGHVDVMMPFYTRASFNTAISTDPRHRFGKQFYRRMIERLDPAVAAVPTNQGGPAQPRRLTNVPAFAPYYAGLAERGFNKAAHRVLHRSFRRPAGTGDPVAGAVRAAVIAHVGTDIDSWHTRTLYNRAALAEMLAQAPRSDFRAAVPLGRILTLELGMRQAGSVVG